MTTFSVAKNNTATKQKRTPDKELSLSSAQILLVEDDPFSQKLFTNMINNTFNNVNIAIVSSYEKAREFLASTDKLNLAIIDIYLEGSESGIDLLQFIKFSHPSTPVIITSSVGVDTAFDLLSGFDKLPIYLKKPFSPEACQTILEKFRPHIEAS